MQLKPSTLQYLQEMSSRHPALAAAAEDVRRSVEAICASCRGGGKVLVCGNGGSAADSEHIVGELMKGFLLRRELPAGDLERLRGAGLADWESLGQRLQRGIPAISLTGAPSLSTAVLNDTDPLMAFAQQVYALGRPGDILIGISTSGGARNVQNALKVGRAFGLVNIGLTGARPCGMDELCDIAVKVPETETFRVQELHLPVYHTICMMVEEEIFG